MDWKDIEIHKVVVDLHDQLISIDDDFVVLYELKNLGFVNMEENKD